MSLQIETDRALCIVLRLVSSSEGVVVTLVSRRVKRYELIDGVGSRLHIPHMAPSLLILWNYIVGFGSRNGRINQSQYSIPCFVIRWFCCFCFRLRQVSFHQIVSDSAVDGVFIKNGNVLILMTLIPSSLCVAHDSDSNSVVSSKIKPAFSGTSQSFSETQAMLELFS